jgi:hypothetical protein
MVQFLGGAFSPTDILNALRDAGIGITVIVVISILFNNIIKCLGTLFSNNGKSSDKRWDDFMLIRSEDREDNKQMLIGIKDVVTELKETRQMQDKRTNEGMIEVKRRFDAIEDALRHLNTDIGEIKTMLIENKHAEG